MTLSQLVCSLHKPMDGLTVITLRNFKNILLNAYCILLSLTTLTINHFTILRL